MEEVLGLVTRKVDSLSHIVREALLHGTHHSSLVRRNNEVVRPRIMFQRWAESAVTNAH